MKITRQKICFFRNTQRPDEYFLRVYSEKTAKEKADCFNHRNGHEESGYPHYDCEVVLALDVPDEIYSKIEKFAMFIIERYGKKTHEDSFLREWGWYEFSDINRTGQWVNEFYLYENKKQQEYLKLNNAGIQGTLL